MENKPSFYEKQAVVLWKTSRRFVENEPSFCEKQAVILWKTSRRFVESTRRRGRHREEVKKKVGGDGNFMREDGE